MESQCSIVGGNLISWPCKHARVAVALVKPLLIYLTYLGNPTRVAVKSELLYIGIDLNVHSICDINVHYFTDIEI